MGKPTYCGPSGAGQMVKACNQIQVALNFIGMAEALVLGAKAGVDPEIMLKVLSAGYAQTRVMDVRGPRILKGDYAPGFRSRFHYKDLNIIRETARAYGASLAGFGPGARAVHRHDGQWLGRPGPLGGGQGDREAEQLRTAGERVICWGDEKIMATEPYRETTRRWSSVWFGVLPWPSERGL